MFTVWFGLVALSLLVALGDVLARPNRSMPIMNAVWPLAALYFGPLGLGLYFALGRSPSHVVVSPHFPQKDRKLPTHPARAASTSPGSHPAHPMAGMDDPLWVRSARSATHCMAGCALGDLTAMLLVEGLAWRPLGTVVASEVVVGAVLAALFGLLVFQAFPVMAERKVAFGDALAVALRADLVSIGAYLAGQIPVFLWLTSAAGGMAMGPQGAVLMQASMAAGFLTSYPANVALVVAGIKHGM